MFLSTEQLKKLDHDGYLIVKDALDPKKTVDRVFNEYEFVLNKLCYELFANGEISSTYDDLNFDQRVIAVYNETNRSHVQYFDFSLPLEEIDEDTPMWHGPEVFKLLTNSDLLDIVESVIGPEIHSNPVQHIRIKVPNQSFDVNSTKEQPKKAGFNTSGATVWHQDQGVGTEDLDDTNMLTVWIPLRKTTEEMGCLKVIPRSHREDQLFEFCTADTNHGAGIPERFFASDQMIPLPVDKGDVIVFNKKLVHGSLENESDQVRVSFDIRYNPIGEATGRKWFPGFNARSKNDPDSVLTDPVKWAESWVQAKNKLVSEGTPDFYGRWSSDNPACA
ncbi:MAG: phytanoyl-CoA dioxygenase family protein [SAR202 cluster bacterium]|nr:phytanoyl-CoA dioxygenase family protein [SAR202 cluster bacterium]|tara:strand:- start:15941 stop:16939 length:999 start_codon:yes stop_codon:yes gene_type:complete